MMMTFSRQNADKYRYLGPFGKNRAQPKSRRQPSRLLNNFRLLIAFRRSLRYAYFSVKEGLIGVTAGQWPHIFGHNYAHIDHEPVISRSKPEN